MRHLIACMSSYGKENLESWLRQFPIDDDLHFIIHIDGKTLDSDVDIWSLKNINPNVDEVFHILNCKRFSSDMAKVMFELMRKCWEGKYDYFHLMSESCWLIKPIDEFKKSFENSDMKSFMTFWNDRNGGFWIARWLKKVNWYKASQWMSLSKKLLDLIFSNDKYYDILKKMADDYNNKNEFYLHCIAFDEFAIQNIILKYALKDDKSLIDDYIVNDNLRYINWNCPTLHPASPLVLKQSDYEDPENKRGYQDEEISKCVIARKIDFKDPDSMAFVENQLKKYKS